MIFFFTFSFTEILHFLPNFTRRNFIRRGISRNIQCGVYFSGIIFLAGSHDYQYLPPIVRYLRRNTRYCASMFCVRSTVARTRVNRSTNLIRWPNLDMFHLRLARGLDPNPLGQYHGSDPSLTAKYKPKHILVDTALLDR